MNEYFDDLYDEDEEDYSYSKKNTNNDSRSKAKYEARKKIDDYFFQKAIRDTDIEDDWFWEEDDENRKHLH